MTRVRDRTNSSGIAQLGTMTNSVGGTSIVYTPLAQAYSHDFCADSLHPGPPYKKGGPLQLSARDYSHSPSTSVNLKGALGRRYNGAFDVSGYSPTRSWFVGAGEPGFTDPIFMQGLGTKGWNRHKPGKPTVMTGQFVGELHRLPLFPGLGTFATVIKDLEKRSLILKAAGSEYLNLTFGWDPFLRDVRDLYRTSRKLNKLLKDLEKDNNKWVSRGGTVQTDSYSSSYTTQGTYLYPAVWAEMYYSIYGTQTVEYNFTEAAWFQARFKYYIHNVGTWSWKKRTASKLFQENLSPSLVYELMPWSWLFDWFSNLGDVISNMSENAAENLVAESAWIMRHRQWTHKTTQEMKFQSNGGPPAIAVGASVSASSETKERMAASPYGFGLIPTDLSDRQRLILAALGVSRSW